MAVPMPSSDAERQNLFAWVIERILCRRVGDSAVEQHILEAIGDADKDPLRVASSIIGITGFCGPSKPYVETHSNRGHITVWTSPMGEEIMRISMRQVVDYVRRKNSPQLSLF